MRKKLYIIVCLLFALAKQDSLCAQKADTTLYVPLVSVEITKPRTTPTGAKVIPLDSAQLMQYQGQTLSEVLQKETGIFIKSYGNYSIATASIRGASASQNLVLWNGLPIESPSLGQLDLTLIPIALADKLTVTKGGNSSSWGSAAIGGTIALQNQADFNQNVAVNYHSSIGSFSNLNQRLTLSLGNHYFQSKTQILYTRAKNDIVFRKAPSLPKERQTNAAFEQRTLLQSFHLKLNKRNTLNFHAWLQDAYKEIPATTFQNESLAKQTDDLMRFIGNWKYKSRKIAIKTSASIFKENQVFSDPLSVEEGINSFTKYLTDIALNYNITNAHKLFFNNTHNFTKANTIAYGKEQQLYRLGFLLGYKMTYKKWRLQLSIRQEMNQKQWISPSPLLGIEYKVLPYFTLKTKITRDYRLPTFNDLFWQPGGEKNLKPEQGWSEELGLVFEKEFAENHHVKISLTYYNRNINNWILWKPSDNYYWEASNIAKVWSWGIENTSAYTYKNQSFEFNYTTQLNYTSSTYRVQLKLPKVNVGDQLLYTPKLLWQNTLNLSYKKFGIQYQHFYTSQSNGINENVPAFHISNLTLNHSFKHQKLSGLLFFTLNNMFNKEYQVIERRPNAGINFQTGININFNHKKSNQDENKSIFN